MNHKPSGSLNLSKAIPFFLNYKIAEGLSERTVDSYERILNKWIAYQGDDEIGQITKQEITEYLSWLHTDYVPQRFNGQTHPLSPKTVRNVWVAFSAFYTWAEKEFEIPNPMKNVPAPRFQFTPVDPFSQEEIQAMLKVCLYSREVQTGNRRSFVMRLANGARDQAIILVLLDAGLRASEFCALRIGNVDLKTGRVEIKHGIVGGAKGKKGRTVFLGKAARRSVMRYLAKREDSDLPDSHLFLNKSDRPFNPNSLRQLIKSIAERANVTDAYPHRFRHTFAITYLRSGGDLFTLQALLGHTSLDMVRRYARIAEIDIAQAHRKASPADNWRL